MKKKFFLLILFIFSFQFGFSQNKTKKQKKLKETTIEAKLDEIVVTGTGTSHYFKDAPVQTEIISKRILDVFAGKSIEEILGSLNPGFDFNTSAMGSGIQLNGLGNSYILILIDGKKIHGDIAGQNDLSIIDVSKIERIEIVKGASSSLYGSDAIAGVINIITQKNKYNGFSAKNSTRAESYKQIQQYNSINLKLAKFESSSDFTYKHSDGWQNTNKELYKQHVYSESWTNTSNKFTSLKFGERLKYKITPKLHLEFYGFYYNKKIFRPCGGKTAALIRTYGMEYKNYSFTFSSKYKLNKINEDIISLDLSYDKNNYYHNFNTLTEEEYVLPDGEIWHPIFKKGESSLQNAQKRYITNLKLIKRLNNSNRLSAGVEYQLDYLDSPYRMFTGSKNAYTLSFYAQDEFDAIDNLNITTGIRAITHKEFGFELTPKISFLYKSDNINFRATYSRGFKTPTLKELFYHYERMMAGIERLYLGNKNLKAQTSNYYSIGFEYITNPLTLSITPYWNNINDMIVLMEIPTSSQDYVRGIEHTMKHENMENAKSRGVDFMFNYTINNNLNIGGGYSFCYANGDFYVLKKGTKNEYEFKSIMVNGSAKHRANMRFTWKKCCEKYKLNIGLFVKTQSKRYYYDYGNTKAYTTFKINSNYKINISKRIKYEFNVGIDNILNFKEDKPFGYNYATTTPGRTFYLSIQITFANNKK